MVADVLEAEWNARLRALDEAQNEVERHRAVQDRALNEQQHQRIFALATDFPRLWNDPATPHRERKRMARLLIEDVTHDQGKRGIRLGVRLRGGAARQLALEPEAPAWKRYKTPDNALPTSTGCSTTTAFATILNERGCRTGYSALFCPMRVQDIRRGYKPCHATIACALAAC